MATTIELADGVYRIATDNYCLNTGLILGLETVSYTHLDVYKRQYMYQVASRSFSTRAGKFSYLLNQKLPVRGSS